MAPHRPRLPNCRCFTGCITDPPERREAIELYVHEVSAADYVDYAAYHWGGPTRGKIEEAHRNWASGGLMTAIDVDRPKGDP